jgi:thioredoxin-like negative regulator of GroEL|eukprot:COSAG01_NODE_1071_length_11863_cov_36.887623_9_plen_163_part_00
MKPAWDQLGDEFVGSKTVLIGDVDCTVEKDLCGKYGVKGYPTVKYFTSSTAADGDAYEGGRDFDSLKKFADESLGPSCSNDNIDLCDDDQKAILAKYTAMSESERKKIVDDADAAVEEAEELAKSEVKKLQSRYEQLMKDKDEQIKALQTPELRLLKSIKDE